jgi:capsular polysaccharide biosynthesis protein
VFVRRTLEAIFRHPLQLLILIVVLPIIGVGFAYFGTVKTYQSTASLWALRSYGIMNSTASGNAPASTLASTQATALTELLQTRAFALSVVKGIDLAPTLGLSSSVMADPQQLQDALFNEISKKVLVTAQGTNNLFQISYTNRNPTVTQQVVQSVISNYGSQSLKLSQDNSSQALYEIIDAPQIPTRPLSSSQKYLIGGGIGLGVALLASIIYLVILVRRDDAIYSAEDLQNVIDFPVVMQLPNLTPTAVSLFAISTIEDQDIAH